MNIRHINPIQAKALIEELDSYQSRLYPAESCHLDSIETLQADNVTFLAAFENQEIIAIGSVKLFDTYGELKRIYVPKKQRGKQLAQKIIAALELVVKQQQLDWVKLETGPASVEAVNLYKKLGYQKCQKFGNYQDDPHSIFMQKQLP